MSRLGRLRFCVREGERRFVYENVGVGGGELVQNGVGRMSSIGEIHVGPLDARGNFAHLHTLFRRLTVRDSEQRSANASA